MPMTTTQTDTKFLPPGPGGEEKGKRPPGSRWPADEWGDEPYWETEEPKKVDK